MLFCCLGFDPKISTKCIYLVYNLFYFYLNCRMVQDFRSNLIYRTVIIATISTLATNAILIENTLKRRIVNIFI